MLRIRTTAWFLLDNLFPDELGCLAVELAQYRNGQPA